MCMIAYQRPGLEVPEAHLDNAYLFNEDGFGLMWSDGKKLNVWHTMDFKEFKEEYKNLRENNPEIGIALHLRNTTAGQTNLKNAHPFLFKNGSFGLMHNGTISPCSPSVKDKQEGLSDTRVFVRDILEELPPKFFKNEVIRTLIGDYIGWSRLLIMNSVGKIMLVNGDRGEVVDDIWYSNDYYKKVQPVSYGTDYYDTWGCGKDVRVSRKESPPAAEWLKYRNEIWCDEKNSGFYMRHDQEQDCFFAWVPYKKAWLMWDVDTDWYVVEQQQTNALQLLISCAACKVKMPQAQLCKMETDQGLYGDLCLHCVQSFRLTGIKFHNLHTLEMN